MTKRHQAFCKSLKSKSAYHRTAIRMATMKIFKKETERPKEREKLKCVAEDGTLMQ